MLFFFDFYLPFFLFLFFFKQYNYSVAYSLRDLNLENATPPSKQDLVFWHNDPTKWDTWSDFYTDYTRYKRSIKSNQQSYVDIIANELKLGICMS